MVIIDGAQFVDVRVDDVQYASLRSIAIELSFNFMNNLDHDSCVRIQINNEILRSARAR